MKITVWSIIIVQFFALYSYGHTGIGFTQDYGNIRVMSYKETDREDFQKAFIIGQLAEKLAQELNYSDPIYLICYLGLHKNDIPPTEIQVSVEQYKYTDEEGNGSEKLIVKQQSVFYNVLETLKLIEYAIKNKKKIKEKQSWQKSNFFYDRGKDKLTISKENINSILLKPQSDLIGKIMQTRIERPKIMQDRPSEISYYWQNNNYYITRVKNSFKEKTSEETILLTLPQIYQFENLDLAFLIFDQIDSFYYININKYDRDTHKNTVSKKHIIENIGDIDFGRTIKNISSLGDLSIFFRTYVNKQLKNRLLLYFQEYDTLLQDVYPKNPKL